MTQLIGRLKTLTKPLIKQELGSEPTYYHLSIDPSSTAMGISVFTVEGKFVDSFCLKVSSGIIPSRRLYLMRTQFEQEWVNRFGENAIANLVTLEKLPPNNSASLNHAAGAILATKYVSADLCSQCYIGVQTWKAFCRQLSYYVKDPKGVAALTGVGWNYRMVSTDDEADSILLYLAWRFYQQKVLWLGEIKWVKSWHIPKPYIRKVRKKKNDKQS